MSNPLEYFQLRRTHMLTALQRLVDIETPSDNIDALEEFARTLQIYLELEIGKTAEIVRSANGERPHVVCHIGERTDVLFVGHFDTVYPLGTSTTFHVDGDRAYGAGVLDMKAGVVIMVEVAKWLLESDPDINLTLFFNADEEIASPESQHISSELAVDAQLVIVFEYTNDESVVKTSVRGHAPVQIDIRGVGGHAAYSDELVNPIVGAAEIVQKINTFNDAAAGLLITPTVSTSGSRYNVVPESASLTFDVRFRNSEQLDKIYAFLEDLRVEGLTLELTRLHEISAHQQSSDAYPLTLAQEAASQIGMTVRGIEARGASDMNFLGAVNPNVIEALGACGNGAHSPSREYIDIASLARRCTITALMTRQALEDAEQRGESLRKSG